MKFSLYPYHPKYAAIVIFTGCLLGMLTARFVQVFRISDYNWIYRYGSFISFALVAIMVGCSFLHPFMIFRDNKKTWKKHLMWIFIGFIPFLYFTIALVF